MDSRVCCIVYNISMVFRVRGLLGSTFVLNLNIGILLAFIFGDSFDYFMTPKFAIALTAVCAILLLFFPETPAFLMKQNKVSVSWDLFYELRLVSRMFVSFYFNGNIFRMLKNRFDSIKVYRESMEIMNCLSRKFKNWKIVLVTPIQKLLLRGRM